MVAATIWCAETRTAKQSFAGSVWAPGNHMVLLGKSRFLLFVWFKDFSASRICLLNISLTDSCLFNLSSKWSIARYHKKSYLVKLQVWIFSFLTIQFDYKFQEYCFEYNTMMIIIAILINNHNLDIGYSLSIWQFIIWLQITNGRTNTRKQ